MKAYRPSGYAKMRCNFLIIPPLYQEMSDFLFSRCQAFPLSYYLHIPGLYPFPLLRSEQAFPLYRAMDGRD